MYKPDNIPDVLKRLAEISPLPDDLDNPQDYQNFPGLKESTKRLDAVAEIVDELRTNLDPRIIPPLVNSFGYGDAFGVNWSVLHLLEKFDVNLLRPHLLAGLQSERRGTRMWAATMLMRQRETLAIDRLLSLLTDQHELVRATAVNAILQIDASQLQPFLQDLQKDPSPEVQSALRN